MCIVFVYINPRPSKNEYRLIIVANRDTLYNRKAIPAHRWEEDDSIIGGRDLETSPQGTWLAVSKKGKIGVLLSIDAQTSESNAISRGVLINNFLKGNSNAYDFCQILTNEQYQYDGFHLLLFDLNPDDIRAYVQTNSRQKIFKTDELKKGIHGFGNSPNLPYNKVKWGRNKFEEIVNQYNDVDKRETLLNEMLNLLKSEKKHYPDEVLFDTRKAVTDEKLIEKYSSVFVKIPERGSGTRTHSIVLVAQNNDVDFNEYTMKEPIDFQNAEWIHSNFRVKLTN